MPSSVMRRLAAERLDDAIVFVRLEAVAIEDAESTGLMMCRAVRAAPCVGESRDHRFEEHEAVAAAEHRLAGAFGVRHQADDVPRRRCRCRRSR